MELITSTANDKIKYLIHLRDKSMIRRSEKCFIIEGFREIERARLSGIKILHIYRCSKFDPDSQIASLDLKPEFITEIGEKVFSKIAYRETSDGLIAVAEFPDLTFENIRLPDNPLILVVESVEKPGNLGAILRTVDAAAVDMVIICDPLADVYNPNVIRSSVGCVFSSKIAVADSKEALNFLVKNKVKIYSAALAEDAIKYSNIDFTESTAIVVGTEAHGLSDIWLKAAKNKIIIPMKGIADSLNVSVSAAVLIFEAVRQRDQVRN